MILFQMPTGATILAFALPSLAFNYLSFLQHDISCDLLICIFVLARNLMVKPFIGISFIFDYNFIS